MTPEEQQRAERLAKRLQSYADHGIAGAVYALCCELDALAAAGLAVRSFWALELAEAGPDVPPEDRLQILQTVTDAIRVTTIAATGMTVLQRLVRDASTKELERALAWLAGPTSPCGPEGFKRFCEQVATGAAAPSDAAVRELLQRMYDLSPDQPEDEP